MFVHVYKMALDVAQIPTWVIMSQSPAAAASPNPLEAEAPAPAIGESHTCLKRGQECIYYFHFCNMCSI